MDVHNRKSPRQNGPRLPKTHGQIRPNSKSQNLCDEVLVEGCAAAALECQGARSKMPSQLFSKFKMRDLELVNRIVVSPMGQYSGENGSATDWHLMHLGHLALSGAGLLISEATAVEPEGRLSKNDLRLYSHENEEARARVIAFCRKHGGAKLGSQLYHGGRKSSITTAWEGQKAIPV